MLIVVRHGRTEANASALLLGQRLDPDLDDLGHRQAAAVAAALAEPDRVVCSPLQRARTTAAAFGKPVAVDERWIELDYGLLDGTPLRDVPLELWQRWRADPGLVLEGGESLASMAERVADACADLAPEAAERDIVVVTHVSPVKAAVSWALGVGVEIAWRMLVAPASVTKIAVAGGRPSLHGYNLTAHVDDLGTSGPV